MHAQLGQAATPVTPGSPLDAFLTSLVKSPGLAPLEQEALAVALPYAPAAASNAVSSWVQQHGALVLVGAAALVGAVALVLTGRRRR